MKQNLLYELFTIEETNFICTFPNGTKSRTEWETKKIIERTDDKELLIIANNIMRKLENITDREWMDIEFIPVYE